MRSHGMVGAEVGNPHAARGSAALPDAAGRGGTSAPARPRRVPRASGPRPVRPRPAAASVRPAAPVCAAGRGAAVRSGSGAVLRGAALRGGSAGRVLRPVPPPHILRRRRVAATVATAVLTAVVVVLLGLLADVAAAARAGGAGAVTGSSLTEVVGPSGQVVGVGSR